MGSEPPEHVTVADSSSTTRGAGNQPSGAGCCRTSSAVEGEASARDYAGEGADALLDAQGAEREHHRDGRCASVSTVVPSSPVASFAVASITVACPGSCCVAWHVRVLGRLKALTHRAPRMPLKTAVDQSNLLRHHLPCRHLLWRHLLWRHLPWRPSLLWV